MHTSWDESYKVDTDVTAKMNKKEIFEAPCLTYLGEISGASNESLLRSLLNCGWSRSRFQSGKVLAEAILRTIEQQIAVTD